LNFLPQITVSLNQGGTGGTNVGEEKFIQDFGKETCGIRPLRRGLWCSGNDDIEIGTNT
jgi:hypothetical protein